jgi:UDP-glucose 4-epimerase
VRDYIHVTDLASAHVLALEALENGAASNAYNLGNGNGFSVKQVIDTSREVTRKEIPANIEPRRPGDPAILIGDSQKIKTELGWNPQHADLSQIVDTAWRWHKKYFRIDE